jgi:hypothetical protein
MTAPSKLVTKDKQSVLINSKNSPYLFLEDQTLHFFSAGADMYPHHAAQACHA